MSEKDKTGYTVEWISRKNRIHRSQRKDMISAISLMVRHKAAFIIRNSDGKEVGKHRILSEAEAEKMLSGMKE